MKNTVQPLKRLQQKFSRILPEHKLNEMAVESGFVQRTPKKLTPFGLVLSFFVCLSQQLGSLQKWAAQLKPLFGVTLSKEGLNDRLRAKTTSFARKVLAYLIATQTQMNESCRKAIARFPHVYLQDSTTITLQQSLHEAFRGNVSGGVQKAVLRLKAVIDLASLQLVHCGLCCYRENDQSAASNIHHLVRKDTLVIRDLGYWSLDSLTQIHKRGAYFLSRYSKINLFDQRGNPLAIKDLLKKQLVDRWVHLGSEQGLLVRLILIPVPPPVAAQRIRKAKAKKDKRFTYSKQYYDLLAYNIFVTNVGGHLCTAAQLQQLYGLRWMVETWFKALKSGGVQIAAMVAEVRKNAHRVRTVMLLALCFVIITATYVYLPFRQSIEQSGEKYLSFLKILSWMCANLISFAIMSPSDLKETIQYYCCYEQRKKRTNMAQRIQRQMPTS